MSTISLLRTPTDLERNSVRSVAEALNAVLADSYALYLKTKNFHWHVTGPHFRDYHLMLDEQAAQILGTTDAIAERVARNLGGFVAPPMTLNTTWLCSEAMVDFSVITGAMIVS